MRMQRAVERTSSWTSARLAIRKAGRVIVNSGPRTSSIAIWLYGGDRESIWDTVANAP